VARFWIAPLGSSFWLDETGTFWTIKDGLLPMFARLQEWPSINAAYGLVCSAAYALGGAHEYVMRLPSVISIALASLLLYRLAKRLLDAASALPALVVFICSETVVFAACDARPYALLLLAVTGSTLALVRWLNTRSPGNAMAYVITAALVPYVHYLAWPVLAVHAVYALVRLREGGPVRLKRLLIAAAAIAVLVAPLGPVFWSLFRSRALRSFAAKPPVPSFAAILAPPVLVCAAALGLLVAWVVCGHLAATPSRLPVSSVVLLVTLAAAPVFLLFAFSILTSTSIFFPRYMIESQVAVALLAGWAIGRLQPVAARFVVAASVIVFSLGAFGSLGHLWPVHGGEDWRGAMAAVRRIAGNSRMPVMVQSGFVESSKLKVDGEPPSYLMAPLALYPAAGDVHQVPYNMDERARLYLESSVVPLLARADRFLLVTRGANQGYDVWIAGRLPGYSSRDVGNFAGVDVILYQSDQPR
jgi:4-amino-4-deoxy-L-arabinose transferase-like glycosyltransferase